MDLSSGLVLFTPVQGQAGRAGALVLQSHGSPLPQDDAMRTEARLWGARRTRGNRNSALCILTSCVWSANSGDKLMAKQYVGYK